MSVSATRCVRTTKCVVFGAPSFWKEGGACCISNWQFLLRSYCCIFTANCRDKPRRSDARSCVPSTPKHVWISKLKKNHGCLAQHCCRYLLAHCLHHTSRRSSWSSSCSLDMDNRRSKSWCTNCTVSMTERTCENLPIPGTLGHKKSRSINKLRPALLLHSPYIVSNYDILIMTCSFWVSRDLERHFRRCCCRRPQARMPTSRAIFEVELRKNDQLRRYPRRLPFNQRSTKAPMWLPKMQMYMRSTQDELVSCNRNHTPWAGGAVAQTIPNSENVMQNTHVHRTNVMDWKMWNCPCFTT